MGEWERMNITNNLQQYTIYYVQRRDYPYLFFLILILPPAATQNEKMKFTRLNRVDYVHLHAVCKTRAARVYFAGSNKTEYLLRTQQG